MSHRTSTQRRSWKERALSLLLTAALMAGLVPGLTLPASAHWADAYLDQLVDWGVMRADQTANPDASLTRAEFMAIINRAYGYTERGEIPFTDVNPGDWFYDDVSIAYTAGYMAGTSETTASPNATLTREQAVCILGRNMMMKETPGESLAFADSRSISHWARGTVRTAVDNYIISGYPDNTFHPLDSVSKGQMAVLITQCVGSPIRQSGTYEMGGVFGNVTITSPNVTLRNTTISGDLYVSGGVGLGGIRLENVNVLGRIVVSGTGESEAGDASVVMRNVTANEMLVDNMRNKTVTIRADGITDIAKTIVRTNTYLEDNNTDDKGLMTIEMDGEADENLNLTLAGRIKEVVNKTPNSTIQVAKGTVAKLTVDEAATGSTVQLDRNTQVKEMNLDVATNVIGEGDIGKLNVNAPGCTVSMLPEKIYIRPGLTANIAGVVMDHLAAEEGSLDPRLLSGYPAAKDIAPTGLRADFSGNKKGTVYWAVSNITDGSIEEENLISPPSYGSKAVVNGSVSAPTGDTVVSAQITGLTTGGSYYLSAMLVDDQGNRSPVKVISFTTPDNTVPAFGQGYPYMSFIGKENPSDAYITAQVAVMATKDCMMYYAVLPRSAAAPTVNELKSSSVRNNLGYGVVEMEKNQVWDADQAIIVSRRLEELKDYTLYMWLTDVDGTNSSAVIPLQFTTPDVTPPEFVVEPYTNQDAQANSVRLSAAINENGTIFWAVVESGVAYPKPNNQKPEDNEEDGLTARLDSDYAKLQVANGMKALRSGRVNATANTEADLNITGLEAEKTYDLYYMAQDTAGNYTIQVYKLPGGIRTQDENPPTVRQFFSKASGQDNTQSPMRDSDVILEFSENICFASAGGRDLVKLYQATLEGSTAEQEEALKTYTQALKDNIKFYYWDGIQRPAGVKGEDADWIIDYEKTTVTNVGGKIQLRFLNNIKDPEQSGIKLDSGGTYNFAIGGDYVIRDLSDHEMTPNPVDYLADEKLGHNVPKFIVAFARVQLTDNFTLNPDEEPKTIGAANDPSGSRGNYKVDFKFRMIPESTSTVADSMSYDLLFWTDTYMDFDLYYRVVNSSGEILTLRQDENGNYRYAMPNMDNKIYTAGLNGSGWITLGSSGTFSTNGRDMAGKSLHLTFNQCRDGDMPKVNTLVDSKDVYYEFALSIRRMGTASTAGDPATWSGDVNVYVDVAAATSTDLYELSAPTGALTDSQWREFIKNGLTRNGGETIGSADNPDEPTRLHMYKHITDSRQPYFASTYPTFAAGSDSVEMNLTLNRPGDIYYAIAKADSTGRELANNPASWSPDIITIDSDTGASIDPNKVPGSGTERDSKGMPVLTTPDKQDVYDTRGWADASKAITGMVSYKGVSTATKTEGKLEPDTTYYVYVTIKGSGPEPSTLEIYKFKTNPPSRPTIGYTPAKDGMNMTTTNMSSVLYYMVYPESDLKQIYWMMDSKSSDADASSNMLADILCDEAENNLPSYYENFTILQALTELYSWEQASNNGNRMDGYYPTDGSGNYSPAFNNYSVFDIYAKTEVKQAVANWLTSGILPPSIKYAEKQNVSAGQSTAPEGYFGGQHRIDQNQNVLGNAEIYSGGRYYVLTVARSQNANPSASADEIYSFRAAPYQITSGAAPELVGASPSGIQIGQQTGNLLGGEIILAFNKKLHKAANTPMENAADFFGSATLPRGVESATVTHAGDTTTVRIKLTDASGGGTAVKIPVTISVPYGSLMNAGGTPALKELRIEIYPETTAQGNLPAVTNFYYRVYWGNSLAYPVTQLPGV